MRWPWQKTETRESAYTDALIAQILAANSSTEVVTAASTGALEMASGIVARAFSSATVTGPDGIVDALTPGYLGSVGRALVRRGECVASIMVRAGRVVLVPASDWDITGDYLPEEWRYRLTLSGPSVLNTQSAVTAQRVLHFQYGYDQERPWRGIGPIQSAALAGKLSAETVNALADESGSIMGYLLPTPKDGGDDTLSTLRADLRNSRGRTHLVESMGAGWAADGQSTRPAGDWMRKRLGAGAAARFGATPRDGNARSARRMRYQSGAVLCDSGTGGAGSIQAASACCSRSARKNRTGGTPGTSLTRT